MNFSSFGSKRGFGIMEALIASLVLGLLYLALLHMQKGNREMVLRLRARDGAVEVAQQVIDNLNTVGVASIPCNAKGDYTYAGDAITKQWDNGTGTASTVKYTTSITVKQCDMYKAQAESTYDTLSRVYAKQVEITVNWPFKGVQQSISVAGTVR